MARTLEFFFDYASPYSYLASEQVEAVAKRTGAEVRWRPFLLGAVFKATGNSSPVTNAQKAVYLSKDLADWARHLGLPEFQFPSSFPANSLKADRLGLVAAEHGCIVPFTHATYRAAFAEGKDINDPSVLAELARRVGLDPEKALAQADSQETKDALRRNTEEAVSRGAFGAPTLFVGDQLFFGNDRMMFVERALSAT